MPSASRAVRRRRAAQRADRRCQRGLARRQSRRQPRRLRGGRRHADRAAAAGRRRRRARAGAAPIAICADESVHDRASLAALAGKYDADQHQARQDRRADRGARDWRTRPSGSAFPHGRLHGGDLAVDGARRCCSRNARASSISTARCCSPKIAERDALPGKPGASAGARIMGLSAGCGAAMSATDAADPAPSPPSPPIGRHRRSADRASPTARSRARSRCRLAAATSPCAAARLPSGAVADKIRHRCRDASRRTRARAGSCSAGSSAAGGSNAIAPQRSTAPAAPSAIRRGRRQRGQPRREREQHDLGGDAERPQRADRAAARALARSRRASRSRNRPHGSPGSGSRPPRRRESAAARRAGCACARRPAVASRNGASSSATSATAAIAGDDRPDQMDRRQARQQQAAGEVRRDEGDRAPQPHRAIARARAPPNLSAHRHRPAAAPARRTSVVSASARRIGQNPSANATSSNPRERREARRRRAAPSARRWRSASRVPAGIATIRTNCGTASTIPIAAGVEPLGGEPDRKERQIEPGRREKCRIEQPRAAARRNR